TTGAARRARWARRAVEPRRPPRARGPGRRARRVRPGLHRVHPSQLPRGLRRRRSRAHRCPGPGVGTPGAPEHAGEHAPRAGRLVAQPRVAEAAAADGLAIHPMFATNRVGVHFSLGSTFLFDEMATFREALTLPTP